MYHKLNLPSSAYSKAWRCRRLGPLASLLGWLRVSLFGVAPLIHRFPYFPDPPPSPFGRGGVPGPLKQRVTEVLAEPGDRPLRLGFYYAMLLEEIGRLSCGAAMLPDDGLACVVVVHSADAHPETALSCLSRLHDGTILVTTEEADHKKWFRGHAGIAVESMPYKLHFTEEVVERHYERLAAGPEEAEKIWPRGLARFLGDVVQAINDSWDRPGR